MKHTVDFSIRDDFVKISVKNYWNFTTEDIENVPIQMGGRPVGHFVEADEDNIYGYGYINHMMEVFGEEKLVSFEIEK